MNSETKFKAWDLDRNKMIHEALILSNEGIMRRFDLINNAKNVVWLQYIGLKDKNGNPIYRGDIFNVDNGSILYQVIYFDCSFIGSKIQKTESNNLLGLDHYLCRTSIKVIGNIYENQNLLK
jgi:uncharacterized phage protein (TIGR01671 family)